MDLVEELLGDQVVRDLAAAGVGVEDDQVVLPGPAVPAEQASAYASFIWRTISGSPTIRESREAATRNR